MQNAQEINGRSLEKEEGRLNSERIVDYIENEIIHGRLRKGDKLPTERRMAEEMSVSRASVREAVKALEAMGVVKSVQGSGNYITDDPDSTINRPLCTLFALSDGTLDNLLQLRALLEIEACKDIITAASDEDIRELGRLMSYDYNAAAREQAKLDSKFHMSIVQLSRNTLVRYLYTTVLRLIDVYRERVLEETEQRGESNLTKRDHEDIVLALRKRDLTAVTQVLRSHILLNKDYRDALDRPSRTLV